MRQSEIHIIGGGLAGSEAALTLSGLGFNCRLSEMRPGVPTPAHRTGYLAELVCSNSFGSQFPVKAKGLLKRELEMAGASLPGIFGRFTVPAGQAFAVDAKLAAKEITRMIDDDPRIQLSRGEIAEWPAQPAIIAAGPLASGGLMKSISGRLGSEFLHFFDAISPSILLDSIDMSHAFFASRYGKGGDDYLNIPMNEDEYNLLVTSLITAQRAEVKDYESDKLFESCLPVEVIAERGQMSLAFGPLKPRGLIDPRTGRQPHAVMQLRRETISGEIYNIVGFQTRIKHGEQKRILRQLPALHDARFARLGSMHLNAYLDGPALLEPDLSVKGFPRIFIAGQLSGGEGYLEAVATGFFAAFNMARKMNGESMSIPPVTTMSGALLNTLISAPVKNFVPVQVQFGLLPPFEGKIRGRKERSMKRAQRALADMKAWLDEMKIDAQASWVIEDD